MLRTGELPHGMLLAVLVLFAGAVILAEDVDPASDGSQYAWGENIGWLNAEPQGEGGPGIQVSDTELTGWIWGENIGWISLSCQNTSSCGVNDYGVTNDGKGNLSGFAWGENLGWINFRTSGGSDCCSASGTPGCTDSACEAEICPGNPQMPWREGLPQERTDRALSGAKCRRFGSFPDHHVFPGARPLA